MKHTLTSKVAELMRKNGRHRRWRRAFSGMAAVVVFITTYMLILPAITMENKAICGMAEHTHTDACYEMQLVCTQEETSEGADVHVHGPECYEQQQVLTCTKQEGEGHAHTDACYGYVCGQEESSGHTHTDACYTEVTHRELTCTEPESAGHSHGDGCYGADGNLVCTEPESTGHTHGDSCYTETVTRELTCGQEESSGHTHTDACIGLICGQEAYEGHTHTDACYTTEDVLVCTEPTGHTHGDGCYEKVLVCDVPEHTHTEACYPAAEPEEPQEPELICTLPEHSHEDACYDADGNLICGLEEHTHTEECYAPVEIPEEETPTTAFPEEIPEGYVEYTFDNEAGLTVTAYAPEGAFGQDVQLFAEVLPEDSKEYAQAKENLDKAENAPEYTGMAAMDIRFVDAAAEDPAQAEEIEPDAEMGQVFVKIDAQALIPEDVDESTLAVQHHAKVSDGGIFGTGIFEHTDVVVETVADNTEETGDITAVPDETALPETLPALADEPEMAEAATLEEPAAETETEETQPVAMNVEAEFAVNSFSKFTITWEYSEKQLTVHLVYEENGQYKDVPQSVDSMTTTDSWYQSWHSVEDVMGHVNVQTKYQPDDQTVYRYTGEAYRNTSNDAVQWIKYSTSSWNSGWRYSDNDDNPKSSSSGSSFSNLYLVYEKTEPQAPPEIKYASVNTEKTAYLQEGQSIGGLYDLTLALTGDRGSYNPQAPVDVLFIVDRSGSMRYRIGEDEKANEWEQNRMDLVRAAVRKMTDSLESNQFIDVQYSTVAFAGSRPYNDDYRDHGTEVITPWTGSSETVNNDLKNMNIDGGTNYQQGIKTGTDQLANIPSHDPDKVGEDQTPTTIVIFLSDGLPTYRGLNVTNKLNDDKNGNGSNDNDGKNIQAAIDQITGMSCSEFYAIGVGPAFKEMEGTGYQNLVSLTRNVGGVYNDRIKTGVYSANNTEDLQKAFEDITAQITFFACTNVVATDPLSDYAEIVPNQNDQVQFQVKVTYTDSTHPEGMSVDVKADQTVNSGEPVTFPSAKNERIQLIPSYDKANRTIKLTFPTDYELEPGYKYSVTTTIKPSAKAFELGVESSEGQQTPDARTGTHADENETGFWSNNNDEAKVTYKAKYTNDGTSAGSTLFPKPVIRVPEKPKTSSLSLQKLVDYMGDEGYMTNDTFTFYLSYNGLVEGTQFPVTYAMPDESSQTGTLTPQKVTEENREKIVLVVTLKQNQKATIDNLPTDAVVTITEPNHDGYSVKWKVGEAEQDTPYAKATITAGTTIAVTCTNTTGAVLPSTGGMGTTPFLALGTLLTLGAGMLLVQRRRKEGSDAV